MAHKVKTNIIMLDWLTITSYSAELYWAGREYMLNSICGGERIKSSAWLQYEGETISLRGHGSMFVGWARQVDTNGEVREHFALKVSGAMAQDYWERAHDIHHMINIGEAKVTRVDVQSTVELPDGWKQSEFHQELYKASEKRDEGKKRKETKPSLMSSLSSSGDTLETVSHGSRQSESYCRIYEKSAMAGKKLLRCEIEWKGKQAERAGKTMIVSLDRLWQGYVKRVKKIKSERLERAFSVPLGGIPASSFVKIEDDIDGRYAWFVSAVLPSLERYLNETGDNEIASMFYELLERVRKYGSIDYYTES